MGARHPITSQPRAQRQAGLGPIQCLALCLLINAEHHRPLRWVHVEADQLRRKGVTLQLLHHEYKERHPDGFQYTWFTERYREYAGRLDLVMRQEHVAGQKLFVDIAGQTVPLYDRETEEKIGEAQIFVSALGASSYIYAEALASQQLPGSWLTCTPSTSMAA
jgi:transposase